MAAEQPIFNGLNDLTYGLYIVTSADGEKQNGLVVNAVFQVTADPAEVAVSINKNSFTHELICRSQKLAILPLEQQTPFVFIGRFGFRSGRTFNKLEKVPFVVGENGCPLITQHTLAAIEATVCKQVTLSTHTLFICNVTHSRVFQPEGVALTYEYYHTVLKGKTPLGATHQ